MVGQHLLTGVRLDRRGLLALAAAGGLAATGGARLLPPPSAPVQAWDPASWQRLVGHRLPLTGGGAVRLVELLDRSLPRAVRFSMVLQPLGAGLEEGLHTVVHPALGPVTLGTTSTGEAGRLLVVVDRTPDPTGATR